MRETSPRIRRGRIECVSLYEVTEDELEHLRAGGPNSIYLNFAILFVSIATSFLIGLLTVPITSHRVFTVFVVVVVVGYVVGTTLIVLWLLNRRSVSETVEKIKKRMEKGGKVQKKRRKHTNKS